AARRDAALGGDGAGVPLDARNSFPPSTCARPTATSRWPPASRPPGTGRGRRPPRPGPRGRPGQEGAAIAVVVAELCLRTGVPHAGDFVAVASGVDHLNPLGGLDAPPIAAAAIGVELVGAFRAAADEAVAGAEHRLALAARRAGRADRERAGPV